MSEINADTNKPRRELTTNRFFLYVGLGILGFVFITIALGTTLTQLFWPPQEKLSKPVATPDY